jgi:hypothetical protein
MTIHTFRSTLHAATLCGTIFLLTAGCNKKADNSINFTDAINTYYSAHPACLWPEPKKFPVQEETSDSANTSGYDALVDQGLLMRTTAEKKKFIVTSKQVNNYDLSDKGRSAWTADTSQPGYGNYCYGHRKVTSIDSSTPTSEAVGATTTVTYHYTIPDVPAWATAAETQTAYPQLRADLSGPRTGQVTLTNTNNGWVVSSAPGRTTTNVDGTIVQ